MAIIFSDNFNAGNFDKWDQVSVEQSFGQFGCGGTNCFSCGANYSRGIRKIFPTLQLQNTFRFHMAYLAGEVSPSVAYLLQISDDGGGGHIMLDMLLYPDGHIDTFTHGEGNRSSPPGLIPSDGTWVGVQVSLSQYKMPRPDYPPWIMNVGDLQVAVNNIVVWTEIAIVFSGFNFTSDPLPTGWQGVELLTPGVYANNVFSSLFAVDNFEIEDKVLIKTFGACTGVKLYPEICGYIRPPKTCTVDSETAFVSVT